MKQTLLPQENEWFEIGLDEAHTILMKNRLGAGGFGEVWRATNSDKPKSYALKHIDIPALVEQHHLTKHDKTILIERIKREASIYVSSEFVVRCYGYRQIDDHFFLLSDFVSGDTLHDWLTNHLKTPWPYRKELFVKILRGVQALHDAGVIHRDLKPSNILVTHETQTPKIIDFGLAKLREAEGLTPVGGQLGTIHYMPPEMRWDVVGSDKADERCDLYALGIILYEMALGRHPRFEIYPDISEKNLFHKKHLLEISAFPFDDDPHVAEAIRRSTMTDPNERLRRAADMLALLDERPRQSTPAPTVQEQQLSPEPAPSVFKEENIPPQSGHHSSAATIVTQCDYCRSKIKLDAKRIGSKIKCPKCGGVSVVVVIPNSGIPRKNISTAVMPPTEEGKLITPTLSAQIKEEKTLPQPTLFQIINSMLSKIDDDKIQTIIGFIIIVFVSVTIYSVSEVLAAYLFVLFALLVITESNIKTFFVKLAWRTVLLFIGLFIIPLGWILGWIFFSPMYQADEMLAQIRVEDAIHTSGTTCHVVSLIVIPENDESRRETLLQRQRLCGDFLGLRYEFTLPNKTLAPMKKPGIMITNIVAFDRKSKGMTGNIPVGKYNIKLVQMIREYVGEMLVKTPAFRSVTYDIKAVMTIPQPGAVITYKLEPLRQQVVAECTGCVVDDDRVHGNQLNFYPTNQVK